MNYVTNYSVWGMKKPLTELSEPRDKIPFSPAFRKEVSEIWEEIQRMFSKVEWTKDRDEASIFLTNPQPKVRYTDKLYYVKQLDTRDVWHDLTFGQLLKLTRVRHKSAEGLKPGETIFYDGFKIKLEVQT